MMSDDILNKDEKEEMDELVNNNELESVQETSDENESNGSGGSEVTDLSDAEKDALGEIGNISMGSASTTLSMLLNQKVNITSPFVYTTTMKELVSSFNVPYMAIYIEYIEGISGFNLLMMKLDDAAILADLMMEGDGTNISEELTDIGISAAAEAMNQMIGSSSTAMASVFGRPVNISPPKTYVNRELKDDDPFYETMQGPVTVASFKMTIGAVLDSHIMQVMAMETAKEKAGFILGNLFDSISAEAPLVQEEPVVEETATTAEIDPELLGEWLSGAPDESGAAMAEPKQQITAAKPLGFTSLKAPQSVDQRRLDMILDIPLKVTALLGRTKWPIKDILNIAPGSVVELESLVDEPVEILVNGVLVAMGEIVVVNENFGVRITGIIDQEERLRQLMQRKIV